MGSFIQVVNKTGNVCFRTAGKAKLSPCLFTRGEKSRRRDSMRGNLVLLGSPFRTLRLGSFIQVVSISRRRDSNPRPIDYESIALPAEPRRHEERPRLSERGERQRRSHQFCAQTTACSGTLVPERRNIFRRFANIRLLTRRNVVHFGARGTLVFPCAAERYALSMRMEESCE